MPLLVERQLTEQWFAEHIGRITASTAAAVLSLNPNMGPLAAYNKIQGIIKHGSPEQFETWGMKHEPEARYAYETLTGNVVQETGFWIHDLLSWLGASPDGLIGVKGGLEIKCPMKEMPTKIPDHDLIQCIIGMAVTDREWWDYFSWMPDGKHYLERVERKSVNEGEFLLYLDTFYQDHILPKIPPNRKRNKHAETRGTEPQQSEDSGNTLSEAIGDCA